MLTGGPGEGVQQTMMALADDAMACLLGGFIHDTLFLHQVLYVAGTTLRVLFVHH
jgi:hypothetical protein